MKDFDPSLSLDELEPHVYDGFSVDLKGAYVTDLVDEKFRDIFYPRQTVNGKLRGGSHVCLPQFGPDVSGELGQHGFGRNSKWDIYYENDTTTRLRLPKLPGKYQAMDAELEYKMQEKSFTSRLIVSHSGDGPKFPIAPGFHPYFKIDGPVVLNGAQIDVNSYSEAQFIIGPLQVLETGGRRLTLRSISMSRWAVWSDNPSEYICIEPTVSGASFAESDQKDREYLDSDDFRAYDYTVRWEDLS